jgi:triacylglycerol esterase/lipase EstA (alpha/beta hydrolase family)
MLKKGAVIVSFVISLVAYLLIASSAFALKSKHPVIFAHGMSGWDSILGWSYFGDDVGTWVMDSCSTLEWHCNDDIYSTQVAHATRVAGFNSSEVRGLDLANQIESFMAGYGGWNDYENEGDFSPWLRGQKVNILGHSQGGIDLRKAAKELYGRSFDIQYEERYLVKTWFWTESRYRTKYINLPAGTPKVGVAMSVSTPHRGTSIANKVQSLGIVEGFVNRAASILLDFIGFGSSTGSDAQAAMEGITYEELTRFNNNYPAHTYANEYVSYTFAQKTFMNSALEFVLEWGLGDIDGFDYTNLANDGDGDLRDDDGLVGVSSARMGINLCWAEGSLDSTPDGTGFTTLNNPTPEQMTSMKCVLDHDHLDIISIPGDSFDEMKFYAAAVNYMKNLGY